VQHAGNFRLVRDPGHWGATNPTTLVLGISKGNTQSSAYEKGAFDAVAFKGLRERLLEVFQSVGILPNEELQEFERRFTAAEKDFAFASVVRCSLTGIDRKSSHHTTNSGNVIRAFRSQSSGYEFVSNCVDQHLVNLAPRTSLVLVLGTTGAYISTLRKIVAIKRGRVTPINEVAYWSGAVKFVHLTHPSRTNGNLYAFIRGEGTSGRKRDLARATLSMPA